MLQVNALLVRGPPAAAAKACVEALQLGVARERRLPAALWAAGEAVAVVAAARLFGGAGGGGG